jgi:hypothetical protein
VGRWWVGPGIVGRFVSRRQCGVRASVIDNDGPHGTPVASTPTCGEYSWYAGEFGSLGRRHFGAELTGAAGNHPESFEQDRFDGTEFRHQNPSSHVLGSETRLGIGGFAEPHWQHSRPRCLRDAGSGHVRGGRPKNIRHSGRSSRVHGCDNASLVPSNGNQH